MKEEQNLAIGSVPKKLIMFALPLLLANLLQTFYSVVDMLVVGNVVGETGLAAISNASMISFTHTSHTKIRHTTINYAALGIWKRFFQFSGSLLIKRDTSSAIWHSDAL